MNFRRMLPAVGLAATAFGVACAGSLPDDLISGTVPPGQAPELSATGASEMAARDFSAPFGLLNPAGPRSVDPAEYRKLIGRDQIVPVYRPEYIPAGEADLHADELVMGVSINGDDRAFPIGLIRNREIVNDTIGGIPVLVTW